MTSQRRIAITCR